MSIHTFSTVTDVPFSKFKFHRDAVARAHEIIGGAPVQFIIAVADGFYFPVALGQNAIHFGLQLKMAVA